MANIDLVHCLSW